MIKLSLTLAALGVCVAFAAPTLAETPAPKQKSSSPTATLYRVDEGVFELRQGEMIDLTDRKVTLHFAKKQNVELAQEQQIISVNISADYSHTWDLEVGHRFDFKNGYKNYGIAKPGGILMKDKAKCFLDLVDVAVPKGAPMIATFRFECP